MQVASSARILSPHLRLFLNGPSLKGSHMQVNSFPYLISVERGSFVLISLFKNVLHYRDNIRSRKKHFLTAQWYLHVRKRGGVGGGGVKYVLVLSMSLGLIRVRPLIQNILFLFRFVQSFKRWRWDYFFRDEGDSRVLSNFF